MPQKGAKSANDPFVLFVPFVAELSFYSIAVE